jgi:hypothetical protein
MTFDDVDAAERLTDEASYVLDSATQRVDWPAASRRTATRSAQWRHRCAHLVEHDAGGCWIAEDDGIGRALLDAAQHHADGADRAMLCASHDPKAFRRYRRAGFIMHPTMVSWGTVDRTAIPALHRVRDGSSVDGDLCDAVDRRTRGAGHGVDHALMRSEHDLLVVDDTAGRGYCYAFPTGGAYLLAATDPDTAGELLWEALARASDGPKFGFRYATAAQEWAVDIALAARLEIHSTGYLACRGMTPVTPYLPSAHFM